MKIKIDNDKILYTSIGNAVLEFNNTLSFSNNINGFFESVMALEYLINNNDEIILLINNPNDVLKEALSISSLMAEARGISMYRYILSNEQPYDYSKFNDYLSDDVRENYELNIDEYMRDALYRINNL